MCKCTINNTEYSFSSEEQKSALDTIRKLNITGPKKVCNSGTCGACAIEVDGKVINSCVTPSSYLINKEVRTIETISKNSELHPIQKAFIDCDGLQCGFCTPGFIVESVKFFENWRSDHGKTMPTRDQVASALEGHLCRCGAYPNIYTAVQRACAGDYDSNKINIPRYDAPEKVTGEAKYTYDVHFEDQLIGYIYRSPYPNAVVESVNYGEIENIDGVYALIKLLPEDNSVRFVGKEIFAVAVENPDVIKKVNEIAEVKYLQKDFVIDAEKALEKASALVYPKDERKHLHDSSEGFMIPGKWNGNIREAVTLSSSKKGTAKKNLEDVSKNYPDGFLSRTYNTSSQVHTSLEPHVCVANYLGNGELDIYLSTQGVYDSAETLAKRLDIDKEKIKVISNYIGGGFGSKLSVTEEAYSAAKLSLETKRPIRVEFTRQEELSVGGFRAGSQIEVKLAVDEKKELKGMEVNCYSDGGIGAGYTSVFFIKNVYGKAPRILNDYEVMTNKSPARPFRAPGASRVFFALESAIDEVAHRLETDPIDLRMNWELHENKKILLEIAKNTQLWKSRVKTSEKKKERFTKGVGISTGIWPYFYEPYGSVELIATNKGIVAKSAMQDIGTGSKSVIRNAILENFDIPLTHIEIKAGKSIYPKNVTSGGSMTTPSTYFAVVKACKELKNQLKESVKGENIVCKKEGMQVDGELRNWQEIFKKLDSEISVTKERGSDKFFEQKLINAFLGKDTSCNVVISEVSVDNYLNTFKVTNVWSGVAAGKIVAPKLAENQVFGGVIQGLGYALFEEKIFDERNGFPLAINMENYKIPGIGDIPEIEVYFHEGGFEHVKGEAIGLAEVVTIPVAGSISNAIFNATGKRPTSLPINFESY